MFFKELLCYLYLNSNKLTHILDVSSVLTHTDCSSGCFMVNKQQRTAPQKTPTRLTHQGNNCTPRMSHFWKALKRLG